MASVYRQAYTRPLPKGAETLIRKGETFARWTDGRGKKHVERVTVGKNGEPRLLLETSTYYADLRDEHGHLRTVSTGCTHEDNAERFVSDWNNRVEKIKLGAITATEYAVGDHQGTPLAADFQAYDDYLRVHVNPKTGFPASPKHRRNRRGHLNRVAHDLGWTRLAHLKREHLEKWLAEEAAKDMGPRTRNSYALSWSAFAGWCVDTHRLAVNPFTRLGKANEQADQRRQRRALCPDDLAKLIDVAQRRPLAEYGRETMAVEQTKGAKPKRSSWTYKPITPENITDCERRARERFKDRPDLIADLQAEGRWRGLFYKTLLLTGLRLGEARLLTVGAATLDGDRPFAVLDAANEKARRGAEIPLRGDLAKDLSQDVAKRLGAQQQAAERAERPIPMALPADTPLLAVPGDAVDVLNRDLVAAGLAQSVWGKNRNEVSRWRINKRDERGRTFDVHAFRTTFNSLLAAAGVPLTTRRILMRHAAEGVTDKHYRDVGLIDLRGALDRLPSLPLVHGGSEPEALEATGTDGRAAVEVIAAAACTGACYAADENDALQDTADETSHDGALCESAVSGDTDESCALLSITSQTFPRGLEPLTFSSGG